MEPFHDSEGIVHVVVNGRVVLDGGRPADRRAAGSGLAAGALRRSAVLKADGKSLVLNAYRTRGRPRKISDNGARPLFQCSTPFPVLKVITSTVAAGA